MRDIGSAGEIADDNLGADFSQRIGTFIFSPDERANRQIALAQYLYNRATDST
jgi:hypothetical protein